MTRRLAAALAAMLALTLAPFAARAGHAGDDPDQWAFGSASILVNLADTNARGDVVSFDAENISYAQGVATDGEVSYTPEGAQTPSWEGHVDCLVVDGSRAWIGGFIPPKAEGRRFALRVDDEPTRDDIGGNDVGNDIVALRQDATTVGHCTDADFFDTGDINTTDPTLSDTTGLTAPSYARGSVTVHDNAS